MSRKIISLGSYLNIVLKNIMFGNMREHFLSLIYCQIWHEIQWGPINPDGGSRVQYGYSKNTRTMREACEASTNSVLLLYIGLIR